MFQNVKFTLNLNNFDSAKRQTIHLVNKTQDSEDWLEECSLTRSWFKQMQSIQIYWVARDLLNSNSPEFFILYSIPTS